MKKKKMSRAESARISVKNSPWKNTNRLMFTKTETIEGHEWYKLARKSGGM